MALTRRPALPSVMRPAGYAAFLEQFAERIRHAQQQAVRAANAETILLYYDSGRAIRAEQTAKGWGAGVILCTDRKQTVVEFTLGTTTQPMGVATYETLDRLPAQGQIPDGLRAALPTPEAFHAEITAALKEFPVSASAP